MRNFKQKELIEKGWSVDKKYKVADNSDNTYLLRVSPLEFAERKKTEFDYMKKLSVTGIPMCLPIDFGVSDEGVWSLQSFIDGCDAEEKIPSLSKDEQYRYGTEAGKILSVIHTLPAPDYVEDWETRFNKKIDRKLKMYSECSLKYENGTAFIDYIATHRHLLKDRPQTYQHGDYHIGNMMIDTHGKLYIIDFNRSDFGDPWEEFNRIVWCAQAAPVFATGMVDGYFNGDIPIKFWELLALYISSNTLSSLPWAIPFGEKEIDTMKNQAKEILEWYDAMNNVIPTWYKFS